MPSTSTNFRLPFSTETDVFRWGPVPGRFFYLSTFVETHFKHFRAKYGENWSETFFLFKDGRMFFICNIPQIQSAGLRVFLRYLLPAQKRKKIYKEWQGYVKEIIKLEQKIDGLNLSGISNTELLKLWNDFHKVYIKFWVTGSVPELANYGSVHYLEEKLLKYIPDEKQRAGVLEVLTAPTRLSFYQEEEIDLSKTKDFVQHQKKYFWLKNSYAGTEVLPIEFFAKQKKTLNVNLEKDIIKKLKQTKLRKAVVKKQYKLPKSVMDMAEAISEGIGWQDERKKYIFIVLHYTDILAREVARRFGYSFSDFDNLWYSEVVGILKGKNLHQIITSRKKGFGGQYFHSLKKLSPKETAYVWKSYEIKHQGQLPTEIKGIIASKGNGKKLRGKVHILLNPSDFHTFKNGEILVAPMTSPEYIFAMRKASALLTDTGGLTSHAAIVSRELGIPCLVGTKLATKIFKNGDIVEVDPSTGIAKKVKEQF